jgi:chromate reductase, NAD(P)H dehydrogenase (quinone)
MKNKKMSILAISGSLRPNSSASALLKLIGGLFPNEVEYKIFEGLAGIPAFDDSNPFPEPVTDFIQHIGEADAVLFCIPEYAFGVPGALKNALDWTVSTTIFSDKAVGLITAASDGRKAHAAMSLTLTALGTGLSEETQLLIPSVRTKWNEKGEFNNPATEIQLKQLTHSLLEKVALSS